MGYTIGYILIGICCFYLIRNIWAGYVLYPVTNQMIVSIGDSMPRRREFIYKQLARRNYYLFVLNPLWWRLGDVFKSAEIRKTYREVSKQVQTDLRNLK
jgi:hypothetical protein